LEYEETAWIDYPYKLIVNAGAARAQLYRLDTDPGETTDVAAKHPDRVAELGAALTAWKRKRPLPSYDGPKTRAAEQEREALRALGYID
jgi:hypothetical protein